MSDLRCSILVELEDSEIGPAAPSNLARIEAGLVDGETLYLEIAGERGKLEVNSAGRIEIVLTPHLCQELIDVLVLIINTHNRWAENPDG